MWLIAAYNVAVLLLVGIAVLAMILVCLGILGIGRYLWHLIEPEDPDERERARAEAAIERQQLRQIRPGYEPGEEPTGP